MSELTQSMRALFGDNPSFLDPAQEQINAMVDELMLQFQGLQRETVLSILRGHNWDVEACFGPLLIVLTKQQDDEKRRKYELEREEKKKQAKIQAAREVQLIFNDIPKEKIQEMLDSNDGDVDETINQLLELRKKDDETKAKQEELDKIQRENDIIKDLTIKFNLDEKEIRSVLEKNNWNIRKSCDELLLTQQSLKCKRMEQMFPNISPDKVRSVLMSNNYDEERAYTELFLFVRRPYSPPEDSIPHPEDTLNQSVSHPSQEEEIEEVEEESKSDYVEPVTPTQEIKLQLEAKLRANATPGLLGHAPLTKKKIDELNNNNNQPQEEEKKDSPALESPIKDEEKPQEEEKKEEPQFEILRQPSEPPVETHPVSQTNEPSVPMPSNPVRLTVTPSEIYSGTDIQVYYENENSSNKDDWIGFYVESSDNKNYVTYQWVPQGTKNGTVSFKAPPIPGNYQFRYFVMKSYTCATTTPPIWIGPVFTISPHVDEKQVKVTVNKVRGPPCPSAWLAVYEPGKEHKEYFTYEWASKDNIELTYKLPKTGNWEFRLFPDRTYNVAATCNVFLPGDDKISLEVVDNKAIIKHNLKSVALSDYPWIGIFRVEETNNNQWRRYKYISNVDGEIAVKALQTPGTYEARLFVNKSPQVICKSNTIVVPNK